jgi:hypothetical protein
MVVANSYLRIEDRYKILFVTKISLFPTRSCVHHNHWAHRSFMLRNRFQATNWPSIVRYACKYP